MADTPVLGTGEETREGSTPFIWTNKYMKITEYVIRERTNYRRR